jgi:predicted MFS family arabinose efflux permease
MDKYFGLLSGFAYSLSFSISGILMGISMKNFSRKKILISTFLIGSLSFMIMGSVNSFYMLFLMRFL